MPYVSRISIDLAPYPDLVVVYLGFRAQGLRGIPQLLRIGRELGTVQTHPPDGLLRHETVLWGFMHLGMRQYWRDLASLEAFTRSAPHSVWWRDFAKGAGGSGFWHETYQLKGGMEGIYLGMPPLGFAGFAPAKEAAGGYKTARQRLAA